MVTLTIITTLDTTTMDGHIHITTIGDITMILFITTAFIHHIIILDTTIIITITIMVITIGIQIMQIITIM